MRDTRCGCSGMAAHSSHLSQNNKIAAPAYLQPALCDCSKAGIAPALPAQQAAAVDQRRVLLQPRCKTLSSGVQGDGDAQVAAQQGEEVGIIAGWALRGFKKQDNT